MKDREGNALEVGDLIEVGCRVKSIEGETLVVETLALGPDGLTTTVALCGPQVTLEGPCGNKDDATEYVKGPDLGDV